MPLKFKRHLIPRSSIIKVSSCEMEMSRPSDFWESFFVIISSFNCTIPSGNSSTFFSYDYTGDNWAKSKLIWKFPPLFLKFDYVLVFNLLDYCWVKELLFKLNIWSKSLSFNDCLAFVPYIINLVPLRFLKAFYLVMEIRAPFPLDR